MSAVEIHPMPAEGRNSARHLLACIEQGAEATEAALRALEAGCEVLDEAQALRLRCLALALRQRLHDGEHTHLPAPIVGPGEGLAVDDPGDFGALLDLAYAVAIRPLMSMEAHAVLASLDRRSPVFGEVSSQIDRLDAAARRLMRLARCVGIA